MSCQLGLRFSIKAPIPSSASIFNIFSTITLEAAKKISKKSAMTLKIGKEAFYRQIDMTLSDAYDYASNIMVENMLKLDAEEGIGAFIEKRKPNWQDK